MNLKLLNAVLISFLPAEYLKSIICQSCSSRSLSIGRLCRRQGLQLQASPCNPCSLPLVNFCFWLAFSMACLIYLVFVCLFLLLFFPHSKRWMQHLQRLKKRMKIDKGVITIKKKLSSSFDMMRSSGNHIVTSSTLLRKAKLDDKLCD